MAVLLRWMLFCSDKLYSRNCRRCGPCRSAGKEKTKDSSWFSRYHKTRKQHEQTFSIITCVFRDWEQTKRNVSFAKKKKTKKINHALNQNIINMQSKNTISLAATFGTVKLQFTDWEDTTLYKTLPGCLYKDNVKRDILSMHVKGKQLYKECIDEKLLRESTISIWAPLKNKIKRNEKQ